MENISLQDEEFLKWLQTTEYNGSIGLTVKFYVKSEQLQEFHMIMKKMVEDSNNDDGVELYKLHADYKDASIFWLTEQWATVNDLKNHFNSKSHIKNSKMLSETLLAPCQIGLYKELN